MNVEGPACSVCKKTPPARVRERVLGSKGNNRNSYQSEYRLCLDCVKACSAAGAIESNREPFIKDGRQVERLFTVKAKTYAWLCNLRDNV
jgi:hypothetical protein